MIIFQGQTQLLLEISFCSHRLVKMTLESEQIYIKINNSFCRVSPSK